MPKSVPRRALKLAGHFPFDRLLLSQANVRRIKAGISIEELAEDIAHSFDLQTLRFGSAMNSLHEPRSSSRRPARMAIVRTKLAENFPRLNPRPNWNLSLGPFGPDLEID